MSEEFKIKEEITVEGITPDYVSYNSKILMRDMDSWKFRFERIVKIMEDRHNEHLKMVNDLLAENTALRREITTLRKVKNE